MRRFFEIGGVVAAAILIAFGIASIVMASNGQSTVNTSLEAQQIYGTPDMTPTAIKPEVVSAQAAQTALFARYKAAGIKATPSAIKAPSCSVAGDFVNSGERARCFAEYMWIHTMGATNGLTYSQMGRYQALPSAPFKATDGIGGTNDPKYAVQNAQTKQPVDNGRRDLWVTYTALTTALNASYMASQIAMFGIVVGVALLLSGFGFGILAIGGALRNPDTSLAFAKKWAHKDAEAGEPAAPAA
jgi:hypothetical protein